MSTDLCVLFVTIPGRSGKYKINVPSWLLPLVASVSIAVRNQTELASVKLNNIYGIGQCVEDRPRILETEMSQEYLPHLLYSNAIEEEVSLLSPIDLVENSRNQVLRGNLARKVNPVHTECTRY